MKLFYEAMIDTFEEMEQALAEEGRAYAAHYARQQVWLIILAISIFKLVKIVDFGSDWLGLIKNNRVYN